VTIEELAGEARRLSDLLDRGIAALRDAARGFADAEHAYRLAHAQAYLQSEGTVGEREAQTYVAVGTLRRDRDYADAIRTAALEAVRSRRTQLSPYSLSSPHTRQRQSLRERRLDPETPGHFSGCVRCGVEMVVPMTACRLERKPWRLVWRCAHCGRSSMTLVRADVVPMLFDLEVAGGLMLSMRESELWSRADADDLSEAFADELL